jgi:hypothetical protein
VAFLLLLIAGVWIVSASLTRMEKTHTWLGFVVAASSRFGMIVAGVLLACGGLLLIIAAHRGSPLLPVAHSGREELRRRSRAPARRRQGPLSSQLSESGRREGKRPPPEGASSPRRNAMRSVLHRARGSALPA